MNNLPFKAASPEEKQNIGKSFLENLDTKEEMKVNTYLMRNKPELMDELSEKPKKSKARILWLLQKIKIIKIIIGP